MPDSHPILEHLTLDKNSGLTAGAEAQLVYSLPKSGSAARERIAAQIGGVNAEELELACMHATCSMVTME